MSNKYDFVKTVSTKRVDFNKLSKTRNGENTTKLINYLKNSKIQYPEMEKEEERELIEQYRSERDKLNEILFMHHVKMVFNICLRYYYKTSDFDDMVGRGMQGLSEACENFDLDRNIKFSTYATWWIYKRVIEEFQTKEIKKNIKIVSLNNSVDECSFNSSSSTSNGSDDFEDYLNPENYQDFDRVEFSTPLSQVQALETKDIISDIYDYVQYNERFTENEIKVFNKIYLDQEKIKDISLETGLSVFKIKQSKEKVLKSIRGFLKDKYDINDLSGFLFNVEDEKTQEKTYFKT